MYKIIYHDLEQSSDKAMDSMLEVESESDIEEKILELFQQNVIIRKVLLDDVEVPITFNIKYSVTLGGKNES